LPSSGRIATNKMKMRKEGRKKARKEGRKEGRGLRGL
jgi:hypothetical protein